MKKIIAVVLALVMVLSMATTAFAWKTNVKAVVANVAATALRGPALLMSYVLEDQQAAIVGGLNAALPVAYKVAERTMKSTNAALQLATRLAAVRINLNAAVVMGAAKLAKNVLEDVQGDGSNSLLEDMISDTENFIDIVGSVQHGITRMLSSVAKTSEVLSDKLPNARIIEIIDELSELADDEEGEDEPGISLNKLLEAVGYVLTTDQVVSTEVKENVINAALIAMVASTFTVEDAVKDFDKINLKSHFVTTAVVENLDKIVAFLKESDFIPMLMNIADFGDAPQSAAINNLLTELDAIDNAAALADWMLGYIEALVDDGNSTVSQIVENAINVLTDVLGTSGYFGMYNGSYSENKTFPVVTAGIYWMLNGFKVHTNVPH